MDGWIKLHRQIMKSSKFADPDILRLWILCLTKAAHKCTTVLIEKQEIHLLPGQFVTGRYSLHTDYNEALAPRKKIKETTLWSWLKRLEEWGDLDINPTNKYSVISITKWAEYQETLTTEPQQIDNKLTAERQQTDTNKNVKKEKNDKKVKEEVIIKYPPDSIYFKMAEFFYKKICEWTDKVSEPNFQQWSDDFRKIVEIDKRDKDSVRLIIEFSTKDDFWQSNILSPAKMREKFEKLLIEMDKKNKRVGENNAKKFEGQPQHGGTDNKNKSITGDAVGWLPSAARPANYAQLLDVSGQ
jgi:hypothetical protein